METVAKQVAAKVGKAKAATKVGKPVGPGLKAEVGKIEPIRETKVGAPKAAAKPAGKPPTGVFASAREPVLPETVEGKGFTADLLKLADLTPKERKEWREFNLDTCSTPKCGRPSVYGVQATDDEDADTEVFCVSCTGKKLGLKEWPRVAPKK